MYFFFNCCLQTTVIFPEPFVNAELHLEKTKEPWIIITWLHPIFNHLPEVMLNNWIFYLLIQLYGYNNKRKKMALLKEFPTKRGDSRSWSPLLSWFFLAKIPFSEAVWRLPVTSPDNRKGALRLEVNMECNHFKNKVY